MKFTKLRILGFKSFVEPTEFLIERGLTGVVGPNGCGKSNLVEAIKWVMGENSYKNMRASGMDDVIFSGSGSRASRNTAEVTLFIDNSTRTAPAAFNDSDMIEITRRIERESGSIYRINGREARAKDVQLLFADASTGARSPSMVGQGRIGELISAKPAQRRQILEEAAGISGLHTRRHEAELRLRATEQNLDRIEDFLGQLDHQLENLKRQSRQANRYRALSGEIRKFEATLYYLRWNAAIAALGAAETAFTSFTAAVADATTLQAATARDQAVSANALPALRDQSAAAGAALQRLQLEQGSLARDEAQARQRLAELTARIEQLDQDSAREMALLAENDGIFARLAEEEALLCAESGQAGSSRLMAEEKRNAAAAEQAASEEAYNTVTREIAELNARRTALANVVRQSEGQIARLSTEADKAAQDFRDVEDRLAQDLFLNAHRKTLHEAEAEVSAAEALVTQSEEATLAQRDNESALRAALTMLEKELNAIETEAQTLARVLNLDSNRDWPRLIDAVSAEPGYEAALGAALGDDLDAGIDARAPVRWAGGAIPADDPALPAGAEPLSRFVAAPDQVRRRLLQVGVVDAEDLERLARALKPGQRLVTRDGALRRWDGFVAAAEAETPAVQRLAQKNRLADLEGATHSKKAQITAKRRQFETASAMLQAAIEAERLARDVVRTRLTERAKARDQLARIENEASRLHERKIALSERQNRLATELQKISAQFEQQKAELAAVPSGDALTQRLQNEQIRLATDRAALAEARAAFETLAREAEIRERRLEAIARERDGWTARSDAAKKQIAVLTERRAAAEAERVQLQDSPGDFARKRAALFTLIEAAEKARSAASDQLAEAEKALRLADEAARAALNALSEIRESRVRAEERLESTRTRKQDLAREIAENLECSPAALPAMAELKPGQSLPDTPDTESRLDRLKGERERLGGVNLRADQEMNELIEKRDALAAERQDLIEAVRQLRVAIANLNREGRERLLHAFDEVNGHFKRLFSHLFGGGTAELQLTESDDPLEAGLDILAHPPGKKPQTMTLLSGGEQALTAMALIFAVFLTNPAPICVLDEVDAPLDDANVERFCNLLDDMIKTTDTRFLTITHNPITMARMGRLFGVTMAERGVSQLVSVDLETAESFREAG
ncbi:MAG: AAA family ATPase [Rhizobiales bacterium]|nr:AAA family ATPase [Hyphomicrobiales bacterium]